MRVPNVSGCSYLFPIESATAGAKGMTMVSAAATPPNAVRKAAPILKGHPIFGVLPDLAKGQLPVLERGYRELGDTFQLAVIPGLKAHVVVNPADVQHVLVDNARNYGKDTRGYVML